MDAKYRVKPKKNRLLLASSQVIFYNKNSGSLALSPGVLIIENGLISGAKKVSSASSLNAEVARLAQERSFKTNEIFASDFLITPGFVNSHTHVAMTFFRGLQTRYTPFRNMVEEIFFKAEHSLEPADVRAFARMGCLESLDCGVTTIWDHYYYAQQCAWAMHEVGMGGVVAPTLQDLAGPGKNKLTEAWQDTLELAQSDFFCSSQIFAAFGPHATNTVSKQLWKRIVDASEQYALPVHCHLAQSPEEYAYVWQKAKLSPMEFLHSLGACDLSHGLIAAHGIYLNETDLKIAASANRAIELANNKVPGVVLVFCPGSQMIFHFPAPTHLWDRVGVCWTVATDAAASNDAMNLQRELKLVAARNTLPMTYDQTYLRFLGEKNSSLCQKTLPAIEEKRIQLEINARVNDFDLYHKVTNLPGGLHRAFRAGVIAEGSLANLCFWDTNHPAFWPAVNPLKALVWNDVQQGLVGVLSKGLWHRVPTGARGRSLLSVEDRKEITQEADLRLKKLMKRARISADTFVRKNK